MLYTGAPCIRENMALCTSLVSQCSHLPHRLHIVTGCLCPAPMDYLPILSGIQPAELCQLGVTHSLVYCGFLDPNYILYGFLSGSSDVCKGRLNSRCSFVPAPRNLLNNLAGISICDSEWKNHKWNVEYCKNTYRFSHQDQCQACWNELAQTAWVNFNHLWTSVG